MASPELPDGSAGEAVVEAFGGGGYLVLGSCEDYYRTSFLLLPPPHEANRWLPFFGFFCARERGIVKNVQ